MHFHSKNTLHCFYLQNTDHLKLIPQQRYLTQSNFKKIMGNLEIKQETFHEEVEHMRGTTSKIFEEL